MSRQIDLSKPLSESEVEYLKKRGASGKMRLRENEALLQQQNFYSRTPEEDEAPDADDMTDEERATTLAEAKEWIANAKVPDLKRKLGEYDLPTEGKQEDLRSRLTEAVEKEYAPRTPAES